MSENLRKLTESGVSIWLDDLSRDRLNTGNLKELIENSFVRGVTTNPSIFGAAIGKSKTYQSDIQSLAAKGYNVNQIVEVLTTDDVRRACDLFLPLFEESNGVDGRVSIEVEPNLAYETAATIARGKALHTKVNRPNLLVKVPATLEGLGAIEELTAEGISINVTLIFSVERYLLVMDAYLRGLEKRLAKGLSVKDIHSVASFFISRIDTEIDKRLDQMQPNHPFRGKAAIANARLAYEAFAKVFTSNRWLALKAQGANLQRPLWASTGVKDPAYDKARYVFDLVAQDCVNTMPEGTLDYIRENGTVPTNSINALVVEAKEVMDSLKSVGINFKEIDQLLENEGVEKFEIAWNELLEVIGQEAGKGIALKGKGLGYFNSNSKTYQDLLSIAPKVLAKDSTIWGKEAQAEASIRLGWIDLPSESMGLLPQLTELQNWAKENNLSNIILCGMGGSSLAPEVFAKVYGKKLTVLDSTDPEQINEALPFTLEESVVVVSSKSGSTVETASQKAFFTEQFTNAGLKPTDHMVIVTDPGSPLDNSARADGFKVVNANPDVGGRYSALSAFGLVPAALMGIDVAAVLSSAQAALATFAQPESSALVLATIINDFQEQNLAFIDHGSKLPGIADWIEQLIAESTGKDGRGRLPVVIEDLDSPVGGNALRINFSGAASNQKANEISVLGDLGGQFIFWEFVTALLGRALNVDPFNQPNVTEAKERTIEILNQWDSLVEETPDYEDDVLAIYGANSVKDISNHLAGHYLAIMAYLNREVDTDVTELRAKLADKLNIGVTFGWGPRFLHSTGQFHKGGQPNGAFLQITGESEIDFPIPGKDFTFQRLFIAQAKGDAKALASRNYPLVRVHLKNRKKGIAKLVKEI